MGMSSSGVLYENASWSSVICQRHHDRGARSFHIAEKDWSFGQAEALSFELVYPASFMERPGHDLDQRIYKGSIVYNGSKSGRFLI